MARRGHLAIYGNTNLVRVYCGTCKGWTLVVDGLRGCCGREEAHQPTTFQRMVEPQYIRRRPPLEARKRILAEQGDACLYCDRIFGSFNEKGKRICLRWDHLVPWSHTMNNRTDNFIAACQFCNAKKSNLIFQTVDEVRANVAKT